jgi:prephenate dehydrogenase (NADP+)
MKIAIIGVGSMGKLHATLFSQKYEVACFNPGKKRQARLRKELYRLKNITVEENIADAVIDRDVVILLPPSDAIDDIARKIKTHLKSGATVITGASVMLPAARSLVRYLGGSKVNIIGMHCLFGYSKGIDIGMNSIAEVRIKASDSACKKARTLFQTAFWSRTGKTKIVNIRTEPKIRKSKLSAADMHDRIMADTQVITHLGFQSMGTAWMRSGIFPWENDVYKDGIDNAKAIMMLRIFHGKAHMYEALAMQNRYAQRHVKQYASSVKALFELACNNEEDRLRKRLEKARSFLDSNKLRAVSKNVKEVLNRMTRDEIHNKPNSHLSLLAMADSWRILNTDIHSDIMCSTPPFLIRRLLVGMVFEKSIIEKSIRAAVDSNEVKKHDKAFVNSVKDWSDAIIRKDGKAYKYLFESTKEFFNDKLEDGMAESDRLICELGTEMSYWKLSHQDTQGI